MFKNEKEVITEKSKVDSILSRGVEDIFVKSEIEKKLLSGRRLRIKLGIDPTGKTIHLGRAVTLRKLKEFQDMGHQIVLIVGDFTALIGDPSDKLSKRPMLTPEVVKENLKDYKKILGKIIDIEKTEFAYNSEWLSKLTFKEICELAETFSLQQMIARRNFKDRIEKQEEISLRELMYPLMQGYDSVAVKADIEIGGFDQLFNLKAGRIIQKHYQMAEQDVLTLMMLEGTDGRKMSTSWGNVINITDEAEDMFGKVMSMKDELIIKYYLLCTDVSEAKIKEIEEKLNSGENPKDIKIDLAKEIVKLYHGEEKAKEAEIIFENTFKKGEMPQNALEISTNSGKKVFDAIMESGLVKSKSELRRLFEENAVSEVGSDKHIAFDAKIESTISIKIGKKRFLKVVCK